MSIEQLQKMLDHKKNEEKQKNDKPSYDVVKKNIEKSYFKLIDPAVFGFEDLKKSSYGDKITFLDRKKILHIMEDVYFYTKTTNDDEDVYKKEAFINKWLRDEHKRVYDNLCYKPTPLIVNEREYNMFVDIPVRVGKLADIELFHKHISILAGHKDSVKTYLLNYMADIIQFAGRHNKSHSKCIIFYGKEGCGKGQLYTLISKLLGSHNVNKSSNVSDFIRDDSGAGRFARGAVNKLLCVFEEAKAKHAYTFSDKLKDAITSTSITYEQKGGDTLTIDSYVRYWFFSNNENCVKISDSDRRFVVSHTSSDEINDVDFWNKLSDAYSNDDYLFSVINYLKNIDLSTFDFGIRPLTSEYKSFKSHNIPYLIRFIKDYVCDIHESVDKKTDKTITQNIYKGESFRLERWFYLYCEWLKDTRIKSEPDKITFQNQMSELNRLDKSGVHKIKNSVIYYKINKNDFLNYMKIQKYNTDDDDDDNDKSYKKYIPLDTTQNIFFEDSLKNQNITESGITIESAFGDCDVIEIEKLEEKLEEKTIPKKTKKTIPIKTKKEKIKKIIPIKKIKILKQKVNIMYNNLIEQQIKFDELETRIINEKNDQQVKHAKNKATVILNSFSLLC